jgi:hypothetical protein
MLKNPAEYQRPFLAKYPALLLGDCAHYCKEAVVDRQEIIRTHMGKAQKISNGSSAWDALYDKTT